MKQLPGVRGWRSLVRKAFDWRDERVWLFRALLLWGILALVAGLKTCLKPGIHSVYLYFPQAARHWWADLNLYGNYGLEGPFRYSPTFAVAATPFGLLPDGLGGALWVILSVLVLVWSLRSLVREVLPGPWSPGREAAFLLLTLPGSIGGIWSAQANALILAMVIFALVAIVHERWWPAAWLLAGTVFIKLWPLAVALLLLVRWFRPLWWRLAAAMAVLAALPFCTRPWGIVCRQYDDWYLALTGPIQGRYGGYRDAWTIWEHLHPPVDRPLYLVLQLATAVAVFGWCLWQSRRPWPNGRLLIMVLAVWSAWQLLFGPGTERLTYGLVAPAQAWAVLVSFRERRWRTLSLAAWTLTSLLSMGDIERVLGTLVPHAEIYLPLGIALCFVWLAAFHWSSPGRMPWTSQADKLTLPPQS